MLDQINYCTLDIYTSLPGKKTPDTITPKADLGLWLPVPTEASL